MTRIPLALTTIYDSQNIRDSLDFSSPLSFPPTYQNLSNVSADGA